MFGYLYHNVGDDATHTFGNYVYLYGSILLIVYTGKMSVVLSCELNFNCFFFSFGVQFVLIDCNENWIGIESERKFNQNRKLWIEKFDLVQCHDLRVVIKSNQFRKTSDSIIIFPFTVPLEMETLRREHFNRWYNLVPYYLSIILFEIPFQVSCSEDFSIGFFFCFIVHYF